METLGKCSVVLSWNTKIVCDKTAGNTDEGGLIDPNSAQTCIYSSPEGHTFDLNPLNRISGIVLVLNFGLRKKLTFRKLENWSIVYLQSMWACS